MEINIAILNLCGTTYLKIIKINKMTTIKKQLKNNQNIDYYKMTINNKLQK